MKALNIIVFDGSLKTTEFINRLVSGLSDMGHKLHVLGYNADSFQKIKGVNYVYLGNTDNKLLLLYKSILLAIKSIFKKKGLKRLIQVIKALTTSDIQMIKRLNFLNSTLIINPDIVHVQWPNLLTFCEDVLNDSEVKIIVSQRGYHINVRPYLNEDNKEQLQSWFKKVDGFHSVSSATLKKGQTIYNSSNKIDRVVYSGIDLDALRFNDNYNKEPILKLVSVGRPHWIKGYAWFLDVCKILKTRNIQFEYTIVGANGNEELLYLINKYQLSKNVFLTDKLPQEEVFDIINKSSLLILSSLEEGLANVVIEAMAFGLPVISTDCGGMSELVLNNETGWLVPLYDTAGFVQAIQKFNDRPIEDIEKIRIAARKKVEEQHNIVIMLKDFENLYHDCLNSANTTK